MNGIDTPSSYRQLGSTGHVDFIVGLGGISLMRMAFDDAVALVHEALDSGVNHLDVAPSYGDAQAKMGVVIQDRRDEVFLSCKMQARDAAGARRELEESLRILHTDNIDLYQLHALDTLDALDGVCAPGGAWETLLEAREEGLVRYLGVTGHCIDTHLATMARLPLDTVMTPVNFRTIERLVGPAGLITLARERGMGIIAIKATTRGEIGPTADAYRFTLSQDVDITMPAGREFRAALEVARQFVPMTEREQAAFVSHCRGTYDVDRAY